MTLNRVLAKATLPMLLLAISTGAHSNERSTQPQVTSTATGSVSLIASNCSIGAVTQRTAGTENTGKIRLAECPKPNTPVGDGPDEDGDGFSDSVDHCPTVPGVAFSNPYTGKGGCPDPDADGVPNDGTDACPIRAGMTIAYGQTNSIYTGCPDANANNIPNPADVGIGSQTNVTASFDQTNRTLAITGSQNNDEIAIIADIVTGRLIVRGRNGTRVNQQPQVYVQGQDFFNNASLYTVSVNLGEGDNQLTVRTNTTDPASLYAGFDRIEYRSGSGNDLLVMNEITVFGMTYIKTDGGDDFVHIKDNVLHRTDIYTHTGNDVLELAENTIYSRARLLMGGNNDLLDIRGNSFEQQGLITEEPTAILPTNPTNRFQFLAGYGDDGLHYVANTIYDSSQLVLDSGGGNDKIFSDSDLVGNFEESLNGSPSDHHLVINAITDHLLFVASQQMYDAVTRDISVTSMPHPDNALHPEELVLVTATGSAFADRMNVTCEVDHQGSSGRPTMTLHGLPGTTINGQASLDISVPGDGVGQVLFEAVLGDGNDELVYFYGAGNVSFIETCGATYLSLYFDFSDSSVLGDRLGAGDDIVLIGGESLLRSKNITTGAGNDFVAIDTGNFYGRINVTTNDGDDAVEVRIPFQAVVGPPESFFGFTNVTGGAGNDTLRFIGHENMNPETPVSLVGEDGDDIINLQVPLKQGPSFGDPTVYVNGGYGYDTLIGGVPTLDNFGDLSLELPSNPLDQAGSAFEEWLLSGEPNYPAREGIASHILFNRSIALRAFINATYP